MHSGMFGFGTVFGFVFDSKTVCDCVFVYVLVYVFVYWFVCSFVLACVFACLSVLVYVVVCASVFVYVLFSAPRRVRTSFLEFLFSDSLGPPAVVAVAGPSQFEFMFTRLLQTVTTY